MAGVARSRLAEERKSWRKEKPFAFYARPETNEDGWVSYARARRTGVHLAWRSDTEPSVPLAPRSSINLMKWKCHIPGKADTDWDGGFYPLALEFSEDYPTKPPKVHVL